MDFSEINEMIKKGKPLSAAVALEKKAHLMSSEQFYELNEIIQENFPRIKRNFSEDGVSSRNGGRKHDGPTWGHGHR